MDLAQMRCDTTMHVRCCMSFLLLSLVVTSCLREPVQPAHTTPWPIPPDSGAITAAHGVVASDEPLASNAGVEVMRQGGNAVDAAVATAFALAVTLPEAGNIGGGGFCVIRMPDGTVTALDFREKAPLAANRNMYLDANGKLTNRSVIGHLAAGVPGTVAGLFEAHKRFGKLPWAALLEPAIRMADSGIVVRKSLAHAVASDSARLVRYRGSARLFLPGGHPLAEGSLWRNPDIAGCLRRIAESGPAGFYDGKTARLLLDEMRRGGGLISARDLREYTAVWRTPIRAIYRGYQIYSMPPPSSGGITIAQIANLLGAYDLPHMVWHSTGHIHLVAEAMRRAFADRNHWLGDPDFVRFPQDSLVSMAYAAMRRNSIDPHHATPSSEVHPGLTQPVHEGFHTTHFSVADQDGGMVALTTTINLSFGSSVVVEGAGFLLNNQMDDFASKPGSPNAFGLVQGEANAIAPGKRILSSMSPTVVLDSVGNPVLITGASGGPRIITGTFQILSNVLDFGMSVDSAVAAPRLHHQHLPDRILLEEGGFPADTRAALQSMGHTIAEVKNLAIGASIMRRGKSWRGTADRRADGAAAGY
jgi:gamma-glutamyltranspeptidase / glutathione hydrolase